MRQNDDNLGLRHLVAKIVEKSFKKIIEKPPENLPNCEEFRQVFP